MGEIEHPSDWIRKKFGDYIKGGEPEEKPDTWLGQFSDEAIRDLRDQYPSNYKVKREWERRQPKKK